MYILLDTIWLIKLFNNNDVKAQVIINSTFLKSYLEAKAQGTRLFMSIALS